MIHNTHKFSTKLDADFFKTLRSRVNDHFDKNHISRFGGWRMFPKTLAMFAIFFVPFALIVSGAVTNPWIFLLLWATMGLGVAGIGVNIMHDANHGAYSKNKKVNNVVRLVMNLLGGDASIWRLQHNVLHHAYTNIHDADEDIIGPPMLRFSPHDDKKPIHRFQHIYAWFLYSLMTLIKVAYTDFNRAIRYHGMGLIRGKKEFKARILKISIGKVFYFSYMLVLPLILAPVSPWLVIIGFFMMHMVTGIVLSIIFQSAHVMTSSDFPLPDENGEMNSNWAVHQLSTTTNFAPKSRIFSWFIGGLNYQIEHHLFANISHIHYRDISKIVSATAREYGIPYNTQPNFLYAVIDHGRMLHQLGRRDPAVR